MYAFREQAAAEAGMELLMHQNPDALARGINPFDHGSSVHTDLWKTEGLKQALDQHRFDLAFGGARRDEEKSRAKERIFSIRSAQHRWDPSEGRFCEVFVDTSLAAAEARDTNVLYRKARRGELPNFTGIDSPYEEPEAPEVRIDSNVLEPGESAEVILERLRTMGIVPGGPTA